MDVNKICK